MARGSPATERLRDVPRFAALSKRELARVDRVCEELDVQTGDELVTQGRTGHEFFLILSGDEKVRRNGREVATLGPGQYFGELALLDRGPRTASVVADTDMKVIVLGHREFAGLLDSVPGMAAKLLAGLARRLRDAEGEPTRD